MSTDEETRPRIGGELAKQLDRLGKAMAPIVNEPQRMADIMRPYFEAVSAVREASQGLGRMVAGVATATAKIRENFVPLMGDVFEAIKHVPEYLRLTLIELADEGWYIDPEWSIGQPGALREQLAGDEREEARAWIMGYFTHRLDAIEARLCRRHPTRAAILAKAFDAHRRGDYELSVPVFLIQADGITHDLHRRELYTRQGKRALDATCATAGFFAAPLVETTPMNVSRNQRSASFTGLNRNLILHGEDVSYGTEEISLKVISHINFTSSALRDEDRWS